MDKMLLLQQLMKLNLQVLMQVIIILEEQGSSAEASLKLQYQ
jgi:hypothetical protein